MKNDNYYVIQGFMVNDLNLSGNELLVYAVIYGFSQDGESSFRGSRGYLAKCINGAVTTVDRALKGLIEKDLIEKKSIDINGVVMNYYKTLQIDRGCSESIEGGVANRYRGCSESIHNNIIDKDNTDNIVNIKGISQREKAQEIIDDYNSICVSLPRVRVITNNRIRVINDRLKKYSRDDLREAFGIVEGSDFLKGKNDRGWKADIDFILKENKLANILEGKYSSNKGSGSKIVDKWANV